MKTRIQTFARRLRASYRSFMAEYMAYFGLGQEPQARSESSELCLPF